MTRLNKQLFKNLPQELYRHIYDYDDTYRRTFKSTEFKGELTERLYPIQLKLVNDLIDIVNDARKEYMEMVENRKNVIDLEYAITMRTHPKNTNIVQFTMIPTNNPDAERDGLYGFICAGMDASLIQPDLNNLCMHSIKSLSPLYMFYGAMEDDEYLLY